MRVAIIDYGSGNLRSATKAFERAAREAGIDAVIDLTDKADRVAAPTASCFPASAPMPIAAAASMPCRHARSAVEAVESKGRPFLGICVGMQLMSSRGLERP
jgi:glutamine amidotransferase